MSGMLVEDFATALTLESKKSTEIDVPVTAGPDLGVTFMADPKVSVTLLNEAGQVAGVNLANSPVSRAWFRSIYVDKPVNAGTWKLKIENTGDFDYPVYVTVWANATR